MLPVRLHPVQTQRMQERGQTLHNTQDEDREGEPHAEHHKDGNCSKHPSARIRENTFEGHTPKHLAELGMSEGESPETEVGSSVGDTTEAELNRMDDLMDRDLAKLEALLHEV